MATNINSKITRFGYIIEKKSIDEKKLCEIKKDLIVKPFTYGIYSKFKKDDSFKLYIENGDYISIPKYFGIQHLGDPKINKIECYDFPKVDIKYKGLLRPKQQTIVNKVFDSFDKTRGGVVVAGCGSGKTNMAIYISCKYKLKTLFVVHKEFLMKQVIDRIISTTNVKKVGIIRRDKVDTDHPFVVGMIQSLCKRDYDDEIFKDFGMIIIDEVHHMGARNFSNFYRKMTTKYMLGISAEHKRKDGLYKIINWYMGPVIHHEEQNPNEMVVVKCFNFKTCNEKRIKLVKNKYTGENDRSTMISNLMFIKKRTRFIIKIIEKLFDQGKNILFLSERKKHVMLIESLLNENKYIKGSVGLYLGGMQQAERDISATKQIILGTYQMAEEGLDIENLNAVILSTPKSAIKQSVGRILRKDVYEEHPIVIDIIDEDNSSFIKQSARRMQYFQKQKYNMQYFNFSDYQLEEYNMWDDTDAISEAITKLPDINKNKNRNKNKNSSGSKTCKFSYQNQYQQIDYDNIEFID